jgi:hypothetical protein
MSAKRKITESKITITDIENPKKTKKEPTRHSAWFITVSTNMAFKDPQNPYVKPVANALAETLQELLNDDEKFQTILNINKRVTNRDIDHSLSKFDVERGPQNGVIHAHGVIQLRHRSNVQLGYESSESGSFGNFAGNVGKPRFQNQRVYILTQIPYQNWLPVWILRPESRNTSARTENL